MKRVAILVAALACLPTAVLADDDAWLGNNTITMSASGMEAHIAFKDDHTFAGTMQTVAVKGTWTLDGGNLCLTYDPPMQGMTSPDCQPMTAHAVGDTWDGPPGTKETLTAGAD